MSYKTFFQIIAIITILAVSFGSPASAAAWSGCGGTYVVQWGDTLGGIAAYCGTSVAAIYTANPGISGYLYAGQVLVMPGGAYPGGNYYCNCPPVAYSGTYVVQPGDTFAIIAGRYGVSVSSLWAANPYIWDINYIYAGQILNVPASSPPPASPHPDSWFHVRPGSTEPLVPRSWGAVPPGSPTGKVKLINSANAEVYVSLQGTTNDGAKVINEYPVSGSMNVKVPSGWYIYVAWVGGQKFSGQFKLGGDSSHTLTFYINKVVVD